MDIAELAEISETTVAWHQDRKYFMLAWPSLGSLRRG